MKKWVTEYNMKVERDRLHPLNDDDKDDNDTKSIIISNDNNSPSKSNSFNSNSYSTNNNACGSIEDDQNSVLKAVNNFRDNIKAAGVVLSDQVLCALDEILFNAEVGYEAAMKTESRISSSDFRKSSRKDAILIEELSINKQNSNSNNAINKNKNGKRKKQKVDDDTTNNNDKKNNIDMIYYDYRDDGYHYQKSSSSSSLLHSPLMTTMTEPRLPSSITLGSSFQLQMPTEVDDDFLMNLCSSSGSKSREQYAEEDQMCAEQLVRILHTMKVTSMMMMMMRRRSTMIMRMMTRRRMVDV